MTTNTMGLALLVALFSIVPLVAAQSGDGETTRPDDAAWVEDCPPDMMCAADVNETDEPKDNETRGPADCEYCRGDSSGMPVDNTTWGTDCPPGVYCMVNGGESDDLSTDSGASGAPKEAPVASVIVVLASVGVALAALVVRSRSA